jgi:hypothetical protein
MILSAEILETNEVLAGRISLALSASPLQFLNCLAHNSVGVELA